MKQKEILTGETYLFDKTDHEKRKHLEGKPFTVRRREKGKRLQPVLTDGGYMKRTGPMHFYNENGDKASACELKPITIL